MWQKVRHLHLYMCSVLLDVSSSPMFLPPLFNSLPRIPSLRPRYASFSPRSVFGPVPTSVLLSLASFVYLVLSSPYPFIFPLFSFTCRFSFAAVRREIADVCPQIGLPSKDKR